MTKHKTDWLNEVIADHNSKVSVRFVTETPEEVALKVLDILKEKMARSSFARLVGDTDDPVAGRGFGQVFISRYSNGREQGFSVAIYHRDWEPRVDLEGEREKPLKGARRMKAAYAFQVAFSEAGSSDDIVVYFGTAYDFAPYDSTPKDDIYKHAEYFRTPNKAASAIVAFFKKHLSAR